MVGGQMEAVLGEGKAEEGGRGQKEGGPGGRLELGKGVGQA